MTQSNNLTMQPINVVLLIKRMLVGAGVALALIIFFLLQVKHPDPDWGKLWMVRPLIIVPLAGAVGGLFYYFMDHLSHRGGWKKPLTILVSLIVYIIGLWLGFILGLSGTLWN